MNQIKELQKENTELRKLLKFALEELRYTNSEADFTGQICEYDFCIICNAPEWKHKKDCSGVEWERKVKEILAQQKESNNE